LWLKEDCLNAGLTVVEITGWRTRGVEFAEQPNTILCHHTATPASAKGDLPTKKILISGRPDLPGPLCQVGLGRDGTVYLIASGKAQHAGKGAWNATTSSARTIGVEGEHPGTGAWPAQQYKAYILLCAVLARGLGVGAERVCGHKEWATPAGRKTDPNFNMDTFRTGVTSALDRLTTPEEDDMTADECRTVVREELAKAVKTLHDDHVVMIRGTATGSHPFNLKNIAEKLGIK